MHRPRLAQHTSTQVSHSFALCLLIASLSTASCLTSPREHLTRVHRLDKFTCPRCCDPMEDQTKLNDHLRSDTPCVKRDVPRSRGINDAQEKKLRERRKTTVTLTDEQKWLDIYVILFPEANQKTLPSPCKPYQPSLVTYGVVVKLIWR